MSIWALKHLFIDEHDDVDDDDELQQKRWTIKALHQIAKSVCASSRLCMSISIHPTSPTKISPSPAAPASFINLSNNTWDERMTLI